MNAVDGIMWYAEKSNKREINLQNNVYCRHTITTNHSINVNIIKWVNTQFIGAGVALSVYFLTTDWTTGQSRFDPRQKQEIFPLTSVSRPALGPTQLPVHWVPGVLSPSSSADVANE